jgi:hypothetical protein
MHLYLIRHADPDYAHDTLTPQGFQLAGAKFLIACYIDNIFTSLTSRRHK